MLPYVVKNLLRSSPKVASSHSHSQFTCIENYDYNDHNDAYYDDDDHNDAYHDDDDDNDDDDDDDDLVEFANTLACRDVATLTATLRMIKD